MIGWGTETQTAPLVTEVGSTPSIDSTVQASRFAPRIRHAVQKGEVSQKGKDRTSANPRLAMLLQASLLLEKQLLRLSVRPHTRQKSIWLLPAVSSTLFNRPSAVKDKNGNPILVSKRVDLKTRQPQPGSLLQEAIPDRVSF